MPRSGADRPPLIVGSGTQDHGEDKLGSVTLRCTRKALALLDVGARGLSDISPKVLELRDEPLARDPGLKLAGNDAPGLAVPMRRCRRSITPRFSYTPVASA